MELANDEGSGKPGCPLAESRLADWKSAIQQIRKSALHRSDRRCLFVMAQLYTRFLEGLGRVADECDWSGLEWTRVDWSGHFFVKVPLDGFSDLKGSQE